MKASSPAFTVKQSKTDPVTAARVRNLQDTFKWLTPHGLGSEETRGLLLSCKFFSLSGVQSGINFFKSSQFTIFNLQDLFQRNRDIVRNCKKSISQLCYQHLQTHTGPTITITPLEKPSTPLPLPPSVTFQAMPCPWVSKCYCHWLSSGSSMKHRKPLVSAQIAALY